MHLLWCNFECGEAHNQGNSGATTIGGPDPSLIEQIRMTGTGQAVKAAVALITGRLFVLPGI
jgi:hypothetical protein